VLAAVYGPREVENRSQLDSTSSIINVEYSMASFSTGERRRRGRSDRRSKEISSILQNTLQQTISTDLLPRTQIDIFLQVLQADGGTRTAAINAAFLALCDAGIPMKDIVAGCAAGYLDGQALLDMNYIEDGGGGPDVVVGMHTNLDNIILLQSDAKVSTEVFEEVMELASAGCRAVGEYMRGVVVEHARSLGRSTNAK
jgi:exosome complex component RRP41